MKYKGIKISLLQMFLGKYIFWDKNCSVLWEGTIKWLPILPFGKRQFATQWMSAHPPKGGNAFPPFVKQHLFTQWKTSSKAPLMGLLLCVAYLYNIEDFCLHMVLNLCGCIWKISFLSDKAELLSLASQWQPLYPLKITLYASNLFVVPRQFHQSLIVH